MQQGEIGSSDTIDRRSREEPRQMPARGDIRRSALLLQGWWTHVAIVQSEAD